MRRALVLAALVSLLLGVAGFRTLGAGRDRTQVGAPTASMDLEIAKVKDKLYVITGGGGNTAAFITTNGVILVDTKLAGFGRAILNKLKTVTDRPVTTVINTHTHGDHNGSNDFFPTTVDIVATESTKANMEKMDAFKGAKAQFLPKRTFKDRLTLGSGSERVELYYFGRGHTGGDAFVVFPSLGAMHSGDMFPNKNTPIIDDSNGGSAVAFPQTLAKALSSITNVDTIITGHGTTMAWNDLKEYAEFNQDFVTWVRGQIAAGKTAAQSAADYRIPDRFKGYRINTLRGGIRNNVQIAYNELQK